MGGEKHDCSSFRSQFIDEGADAQWGLGVRTGSSNNVARTQRTTHYSHITRGPQGG